MTINYNVTGPQRKKLVEIISNTTGTKAKYLGMPTAAYEIGSFTVSREGILEIARNADTEFVEKVLVAISDAGFNSTPQEETSESTAEASTDEVQSDDLADVESFEIRVPLESLEIENFRKLLLGKASLIKKAFAIAELPVNIVDEMVVFPWFGEVQNCEERHAYTTFISALCEMSKKAKRVSLTDKPVDNEKYAFRCFLLRLGFIGAEYKTDRKILLRNFTGSSAFKTEPEKTETEQEQEAE